jgi:hypothetical protein
MQSHLHHPTSSPPSYSRVQSHQRSDDVGSNVYYGAGGSGYLAAAEVFPAATLTAAESAPAVPILK